ncbi:VOC family protein [Arthrobacter sp. M4]|uniref:VOC family protein n=1 Tax=Arthrobacter sp. M4 TaxID=218160 RepID=UPI001CDB6626|nr:VOC family protein [Arthrobacter sp. M4]MCA4135688.1 hypothetical protein [Arthrobacter sp. M4]
MPHRILIRSVLIDVPSQDHARALAFWETALQARARQGSTNPEYHVLDGPASRDRVLVQDVGESAARFHIDIETDDVGAEVARLTDAGAVEVERHSFLSPWPHGRRFHAERIDHYVVMQDPVGLVFCVVPAESEDFGEHAKTVD